MKNKSTEIKKKTAEELLEEISNKIDRLTSIIAIQGKEPDEKIAILRSFNLEWDEIGKYCGLAADAARMRYQRKNKN